MSDSKWTKDIKNHLGEYKKNKLGIEENGTYNYKGEDVEHNYILPEAQGERNYLDEVAKKSADKIKKHQYYHHLNSSQTMCVNFFAHLTENRELLKLFLEKIAGVENVENINECKFEHIQPENRTKCKSEHIQKGNRTNFDFYCKDDKGVEYFFEIKYTESNFGKKSNASHPGVNYKESYERFVKDNWVFKNINNPVDALMNENSQIYRNLLFIPNEKAPQKNNYALFITMDTNNKTKKDLEEAINKLGLDDKQKSYIKCLYWERIVDKFIALLQTEQPQLVDYYKEFKEKYIPNWAYGY